MEKSGCPRNVIQSAPNIHYKVTTYDHTKKGKYQLQSAQFLLMLVLLMNIMPHDKMQRLETKFRVAGEGACHGKMLLWDACQDSYDSLVTDHCLVCNVHTYVFTPVMRNDMKITGQNICPQEAGLEQKFESQADKRWKSKGQYLEACHVFFVVQFLSKIPLAALCFRRT